MGSISLCACVSLKRQVVALLHLSIFHDYAVSSQDAAYQVKACFSVPLFLWDDKKFI